MRAVCQGTHYPFFEVTSSLFGNLVFLFIPPGLQSLATSFNTRLLLIFSIVSKLQGRGLLMPRQFIPSSQSPCLEGEWVIWWCQNLGSGGKGSEWVPRVQHFQGYPPVESPLDRSEKEINPEYSLEGLILKLQYSKYWPSHLMWRANSLEKTMMLGKIEGRRRWGIQDEMIGWYHWLNGHEFEQAPGLDDGQGSLECCSPWRRKKLHMT